MAKKRVVELAKELGISTKEVIQAAKKIDLHIKSHMTGLTEEQVNEITKIIETKKENKPEVEERKAKDGVIIRRRKKEKPSKKVEKEEEKEKPQEKKVKPVAKIISTPKKEVSEEPKSEEPKKEIEEKINKPSQEELKAKEVKPAQEETKEKHISKADKTKEEAKVPNKKSRRRRKPAFKTKKEKVQVKIISKPEVEDKTKKTETDKPKAEEKVTPQVTQKAALLPKDKITVSPVSEEKKEEKKKGKKAFWKEEKEEKDLFEAKKKKVKKTFKEKAKRVVDFSDYYEDETEEIIEPLVEETVQPKPAKTKKKKKGAKKEEPKTISTQPLKSSKRKIKIEEAIRVADLAQKMGVKAQEIIKLLFSLGVMATINQTIDIETASLVAAEFNFEVEKSGFNEEDYLKPKEEDKPEDLKPRPPVVTIMGHVDHGKTSLLDAIRSSNITAKEAGGITQHIGAYYVKTAKGDVVFLDTPGHEAFTAMRARGAQVTDIVVLVVAADDGVMDQTREAISHAKAAGVPIVVAINKIDKEGANPDRVKRELAEHGLIPEDWGGDTIFTEVSAKKKIGLDELLEMLLLQAEVLELKANPNKPARGYIIEAKLDKGKGPVGTLLIQEGTLKQGDAFVCGIQAGKVRAMLNDQGKKIKEAGPSMPVEIQGFDGLPQAGDEFIVVENEKVARKIAETRQAKQREKELAKKNKVSLESFLQGKLEEETKNLNLVIKADVQGSLEAISEALRKLSTEEVKINIIHGGTGAITESDIMLAAASSAIIIGFNVRPTAKIKQIAEQEDVEIRFYDIIYNLTNDIKDAMSGMLSPVVKEEYLGQAEVLQTFNVPKIGRVAGCMVVDGKLMRNASIRLLRDGVVIYTGKLSSLKRFKDDVKEVQKGYECGVGLENYNDIKVGDIIEAFQEVEEKATLE